jgi:hypothetical protein
MRATTHLDLGCDYEAKEGFVFLEQATADLVKDFFGQGRDQRTEAKLEVFVGGGALQAVVEELAEEVQRILVPAHCSTNTCEQTIYRFSGCRNSEAYMANPRPIRIHATRNV